MSVHLIRRTFYPWAEVYEGHARMSHRQINSTMIERWPSHWPFYPNWLLHCKKLKSKQLLSNHSHIIPGIFVACKWIFGNQNITFIARYPTNVYLSHFMHRFSLYEKNRVTTMNVKGKLLKALLSIHFKYTEIARKIENLIYLMSKSSQVLNKLKNLRDTVQTGTKYQISPNSSQSECFSIYVFS